MTPGFSCPLPLKHRRYPWGPQPKEERLTIAIGLLHKEGLLLGVDTQVTGPDTKEHESKLREFRHGKNKVFSAYAGHSPFANAALDKIGRRLQSEPKGDTLKLLEQIHQSEYKRLVHTHPDRHDTQLWYQFLFVLQTQGKPNKPRLFCTFDWSMREVHDAFQVIGIGQTFGSQMMRPKYWRSSGTGGNFGARLLMAATLGAAKEHVPDCGGMSLIRDIRTDGSHVDYYNDAYLTLLEEQDRMFRSSCWLLELQLTDPDMKDEHFELNFQFFIDSVRARRTEWKPLRERHAQHTKAFRLTTRPRAK
jgi:hypothetical protein